MKRVLFVCTGNICRSPTADGIARHVIATSGLEGLIEVDSAGIQGYHAGEAPDPRTCKVAAQRGYDLSDLRARKIELRDYQQFDLILAMDRGHLDVMMRNCPEVYRPKLGLFLDFADDLPEEEVPDPYYGGPAGFDLVLDLCERGVEGLLSRLSCEV
ncbi:low molecular weight phosphotyrosine protein phosphatase [Azoarcus communis]|uniref:low molecular weight protein-tyrosine-phosphatase n=1 Tax=Parazoarcus communis TaxID=41977 RepID=UPI00145937DD|nr:low molecular weight protein-tyrosine-phosphatase [Parazoarcus communis]NMG47018.1 low molecular weight phosphotyrosine protein phosphatase [Parazoarcus communis]